MVKLCDRGCELVVSLVKLTLLIDYHYLFVVELYDFDVSLNSLLNFFKFKFTPIVGGDFFNTPLNGDVIGFCRF